MTIAERGRDVAGVSTAEMFSWSELPELLAGEDLFECTAAGERGRVDGCGGLVARGEIDDQAEDEDDDFDDDEDEDDEDDDFDDEEDDDEEDEED